MWPSRLLFKVNALQFKTRRRQNAAETLKEPESIRISSLIKTQQVWLCLCRKQKASMSPGKASVLIASSLPVLIGKKGLMSWLRKRKPLSSSAKFVVFLWKICFWAFCLYFDRSWLTGQQETGREERPAVTQHRNRSVTKVTSPAHHIYLHPSAAECF